MTNLILRVNITTDTNISYAVDDTKYKNIGPEDYLIFSKGNDTVIDGEPIPTSDQLHEAATRIGILDETEIPKCFLAKVLEDKLYEIPGANSGDHQYVFCFSFTGVTTIEPELQIWDDFNLNTSGSEILGKGVADDTWIRAIATNSIGLPGADWIGQKLCGDTYKLLLNESGGPLTEAKDLYCNIHIDIPKNYGNNVFETPKFFVKFI